MKRLLPTIVRLAVVVAVVLLLAPNAGASSTSGPSLTLDRQQVSIGARLVLKIAGFHSQFVTIATCGNEARRGSVDCNLIASQGLRLDPDGGSGDEIVVAEPPTECPCVIRVGTQANDEVVTAPIDIEGHPKGAVVDPPLLSDAVAVAVDVRQSSSGVIDGTRAAMGGGARYSVVVKVTNKTTVPLRNIALFGSVGRGATDELATLDIPKPDEILPGQTWEQRVFARVPSPTFGSFTFRVSATGAGPTVDAAATLRHATPMLFALLALLTLEMTYVTYRWLTRRRLRKQSAAGDAVGDDDVTVEERVPHYTA